LKVNQLRDSGSYKPTELLLQTMEQIQLDQRTKYRINLSYFVLVFERC